VPYNAEEAPRIKQVYDEAITGWKNPNWTEFELAINHVTDVALVGSCSSVRRVGPLLNGAG